MKNKFYTNTYNGKNSKISLFFSGMAIILGISGFMISNFDLFNIGNNIFLLSIGLFGAYNYYNAPYLAIYDDGFEVKSSIFRKSVILRNKELESLRYGISKLKMTTKTGKIIDVNLTVLGYEDRQKIKRHLKEVDMDRFEIYHN